MSESGEFYTVNSKNGTLRFVKNAYPDGEDIVQIRKYGYEGKANFSVEDEIVRIFNMKVLSIYRHDDIQAKEEGVLTTVLKELEENLDRNRIAIDIIK